MLFQQLSVGPRRFDGGERDDELIFWCLLAVFWTLSRQASSMALTALSKRLEARVISWSSSLIFSMVHWARNEVSLALLKDLSYRQKVLTSKRLLFSLAMFLL